MSRNKQLSFPFEPKTYISPYDEEYHKKIRTLDLRDGGERVNNTIQRLIQAGDAINGIFSWDDTVEGMYFWSHAADALYSMAEELERRQGFEDLDDAGYRVRNPWGGGPPIDDWNVFEYDDEE